MEQKEFRVFSTWRDAGNWVAAKIANDLNVANDGFLERLIYETTSKSARCQCGSIFPICRADLVDSIVKEWEYFVLCDYVCSLNEECFATIVEPKNEPDIIQHSDGEKPIKQMANRIDIVVLDYDAKTLFTTLSHYKPLTEVCKRSNGEGWIDWLITSNRSFGEVELYVENINNACDKCGFVFVENVVIDDCNIVIFEVIARGETGSAEEQPAAVLQ